MRRGPAPVWLAPAGDGGAWRALVAACHGAAAAALLAWQQTPLTLAASAAIGLASLLAWRALQSPAEPFGFDGEQWRLGTQPVRPKVALDTGTWLLLRLERDDAPRAWLPVSATAAGAQWPALCAALVAAGDAERP